VYAEKGLLQSGFFFKENVRYPVWICRDPISLILGTRIGSLKRLRKTLLQLLLCKCTLFSARNLMRQTQPHILFNKFQIWRFFLNASAGH